MKIRHRGQGATTTEVDEQYVIKLIMHEGIQRVEFTSSLRHDHGDGALSDISVLLDERREARANRPSQ
jgi:hypothetical protein